MRKLDTLVDQATQLLNFLLNDGNVVEFGFNYRAAVQRWTMDVTYGRFSAKGIMLAQHPNILRAWRDVIPFGLAVSSTDIADPFKIDDFVSGRISLYVLDSTGDGTDVEQVEETFFS